MPTYREQMESDDLSRCIDDLNAGKRPQCKERETAELVAVAAMVRAALLAAPPPQSLVQETVASIIAEQAREKNRRRSRFLSSGVVGTAAAVLLVAATMQLSPFEQPRSYSVVPKAGEHVVIERASQTEIVPPAAAPPVAEEKPAVFREPSQPLSRPAAPIESRKEGTVAEAPKPTRTGNGSGTLISASLPADTPPVQAIPPDPAAVKQADRPAVMARTAVPAENSAKSLYGTLQPERVADVAFIPGLTPDQTGVSSGDGTRQVYRAGTPEEFSVTVRKSGVPGTDAAVSEKPAAGMNRATVVRNGYEVTVEGSMAKDELMKLARSVQLP